MPFILQLETATSVCSVSLAVNGLVISREESTVKNSHASLLHVFIDKQLKESGFTYGAIDAIAVSMGPGSYTGLRIGVAAAKGLGFTLDKPVIGINTLQSMAAHFRSLYPETTTNTRALFCPMIDARRLEVYTALFDTKGREITQTEAMILNDDSFNEIIVNGPVHFFGDGSDKFRNLIHGHPNAHFYEHFSISSEGLTALALKAYNDGKFIDLAYFEPFYLKDFIPGVKKNG